MALYEANFLKLNQLVANLDNRAGVSVSYSEEDCNLYLCIGQRAKYTCDLRLTYLFPDLGGSIADPDLVARVYLDARMAEVRGWIDEHRHTVLQSLDRRYSRVLDRCWVRNIMFSKWLDYLLEKGHGFSTGDAPQGVHARTVDSVTA
jgi:uncharacterized protein YqiB (DUF1249 family)